MNDLAWQKTLIAAAVAAATLPARAAEPVKEMSAIRVEADEADEGVKAETQTDYVDEAMQGLTAPRQSR